MMANCELRLGFFFTRNLFRGSTAVLGNVVLDGHCQTGDPTLEMFGQIKMVMPHGVAPIAGVSGLRCTSQLFHLGL